MGGALFDRFGIRGPCLFGIFVVLIDLIGRLLLIERREALAWGFDPAARANLSSDYLSDSAVHEAQQYGTFTTETGLPGERGSQLSHAPVSGETDSTDPLLDRETGAHATQTFHTQHDQISFFQLIRGLCMSSRAVAAVVNSLVCGYVEQWHMQAHRFHRSHYSE